MTARVAAPDRSAIPWIALGVGLLLTAAGLFVLGQARARARSASEQRYRTVVDQLNEGVVLQDADLRIVTANAAALKILGLRADQLRGSGSLDPRWRAVRDDGSPLAADEYPAVVALRSGEPQLDQIIGVHRHDGTLAWVNVSAQPLYEPGAATPYAVVASFADVTGERERAATVARERAALAEAQVIAHVGSWSWDPATDRADWSREMYRIFGRDPAQGPAAGEDLFAYLHPDDRDRIAAAYAQAFAAGKRFELEYRIQADTGEVRSLYGIGRRDGSGCYVGTVQDITERKQIERSLRDAEQLLALSFDHSPLGMTISTPDRRVLRINRAFADMLGYTVQELIAGQHPTRFTHPDDVAIDVEQLRALHAGDADVADWEKRYLHADGHSVWAHVSVAVLRDGDGSLRHFISQIQDVSQRKQRDAEERALRHVAELVAQGAGSAAVFAAVAERVCDLFDARGAVVSRFDAAARQGVVLSGATPDGIALAGSVFDLDGVTASAQVFRSATTVRIDSPRDSTTDHAAASLRQLGVTGEIAVPIIVAGKLWGTIGAAFAGDAIPTGIDARLERFAGAISVAIANAEAWDTLARQAATDAVTGLANNRAFHERLLSEVERARRHRRDLSVVLFDLDHFKHVNDMYGHQAGDRVLAEIASRLRHEARDGDLVARIGGEEFAWLMPETDQQGAYRVADRARRAIEDVPFHGVGTITVSAGVCASDRGCDADELIRYADRALYWAKDSGRNTTFVYTEAGHAILTRQSVAAERFQTMSSVRALARAIDSKDISTRSHSERVARIAEQLALELGWTTKRARLLHTCALLHDVGKIGIPDAILLKPGRLTADEYEQIKRHSEIGAYIAAEVLEHEQVTWIRGHHERWDGGGYPDRLAGEQIPDGAQLLALADAWDVMTQNRSYKATKTTQQALAECQAQSGLQFAPAAVTALVGLAERGTLSPEVAGEQRVR